MSDEQTPTPVLRLKPRLPPAEAPASGMSSPAPASSGDASSGAEASAAAPGAETVPFNIQLHPAGPDRPGGRGVPCGRTRGPADGDVVSFRSAAQRRLAFTDSIGALGPGAAAVSRGGASAVEPVESADAGAACGCEVVRAGGAARSR